MKRKQRRWAKYPQKRKSQHLKKSSTYRITAKPLEGLEWLEGTIDGFYFQAKVYDTGSKFSINNGRVSKLTVRDGRNYRSLELFSYDRGWDKKPTSNQQRALLRALLEYLEVFPTREHWHTLAGR